MFIEELKNLSYPWTDFLLFFLYLISITQGLISNLLIFITLIRTHKTKSATYILMSNMAVADLISALLILAQWYFCSEKFFFQKNSISLNDTPFNDTSFNNTSLNYSYLNNISLNYTLLNNTSFNDNQYYIKKNSTNSNDKNIEIELKKNLLKEYKLKNDQKINLLDNLRANQQVHHILENNFIQKNQLAEKSIQLDKNVQAKNDKAISIFQLNLANKSFDKSKHIIFEPISSNQAFNYIFLNDKKRNFSLISYTENNFKKFSLLKDFQYIHGNYQNSINPIDKLKNTSVLVEGNKILENNLKKQNLNNRTLSNDTNLKSKSNDRFKRLNYLNNQNLILNYIRIRKNSNSNHSFLDNFNKKIFMTKNSNKNLSNQESFIDSKDKNFSDKKINIASKLQSLIKKLTKKKLEIKRIKLINKLPNYQQRICVTLETLQMSSYYVSTLTMAGIAYNRYRLINKPMAPKMDTTLFITIIWFTSISISILASLSSLRIFVFFTPERFIDCRIILKTNDDWNLRKLRAISLMIIQFLIPLSCISFFYIKVIKEFKNCGSSRRNLPSTFSTNSFTIESSNFHSLKLQNYKLYKLNEPKNLLNENVLIDQNNNLKESKNFENNCLSNYNKSKRFSFPISSLNETLKFNYEKNYPKSFNQFQNPFDQINQNSYTTKPKKMKKLSISIEKFFNFKKNSLNSQSTFGKLNNLVSNKNNLSDWELDQTKRRLTKMMITVVLLFTISWIPIHAMHIKQFFIDKYEDNNYCDSSFIYLFFYWMAYSTFIYNPIVYLYFSKELRKDTKDTLTFLFRRKKSKV